MPGERIGPEAGQPLRDQRPAHRRGERDERRQGSVSIRSAMANCACRSAGRGAGQARRSSASIGRRIADRARLAGEVAQVPAGEIGRARPRRSAAGRRRARGADPHGIDPDQPPVAAEMGEDQAVARARRASRRGAEAAPRPERGDRPARPRARSACGEAAQSGWAGRWAAPRRPARPGWCAAARPRQRRARRRAPGGRPPCASARRTAGSASGPSRAVKARPNRPRDRIEDERLAGRLGGARERQVADRAADHQSARPAREAGDRRAPPARRAAGCRAAPPSGVLVLAVSRPRQGATERRRSAAASR